MWTGVLVGSVALTAGSGVYTWHEWSELGWTQAEVDKSNAEGRDAAAGANIGYIVTATGFVLTSVSLYKVLTIKPDRKEDKLVVVPTVSTRGAGASLTLRW